MYKVLLVDDEPSVIERLAMIDWDKYGFSVCGTAGNGEDALEIIKLSDPDLVITDLKMPVIDGLKLISLSSELHMRAKFIILSGYSEFTFAREALRLEVSEYILKPFDYGEIEETICKMAQQIRYDRMKKEYADKRLVHIAGQTIRRIIEGEGGEQLLERAAKLLDMGPEDEIKCLLVDTGPNKPKGKPDTGSLSPARTVQVWEVLESALGEYRQNLFDDDEGRFGILLHKRMPFYDNISPFTLEMAERLKGCVDGPVLLSESAPAKGLDKLAVVYAQSRLALGFSFFFNEDCLIRYEDVRNRTLDNLPCMENPKDLMDAICGGTSNKIASMVQNLFFIFREVRKAPDSVRAFIRNLEFEAIKLVSGLNGNTETIIQTVLELDKGMEFLTMSELQDSFLKFCFQLADIIGSLRQSDSRDVVTEVKSYIMSNYSKEIKLRELASVFYINPTYLGQLFRKTTGMQFNEYLHTVRIKEAKKLLKRTTMKISDIALAVSYSDPKYFLSKFKSIVNQSPSDYKLKKNLTPQEFIHENEIGVCQQDQ